MQNLQRLRARFSSLLLHHSKSFTSLRSTDYSPSRTFAILLRLPPSSRYFYASPYRSFSSNVVDDSQTPAPIDYRYVLQEDEFHRLADSTIHHLLEKFEEYGDTVEVDGFDVDYGNGVLTLKLGDLGSYVVNKQTPNKQIWLSSPMSGPSRYDWDPNAQAWIYRRNQANLLNNLEKELEQLCACHKEIGYSSLWYSSQPLHLGWLLNALTSCCSGK